MTLKSVEIHYDIAALPGIAADDISAVLEFRNAAMDLIEEALQKAGAGDWEGADVGMGEVSFVFTVKDFDKAEAIIRKAVENTPYQIIREISRNELDVAARA